MQNNIPVFFTTADLLGDHKLPEPNKHIFYEFQYYGMYLAKQLRDQAHTTLYIKLAKETDRAFLEQSLDFVRGSNGVKNCAGLFMWKLSQLKKG